MPRGAREGARRSGSGSALAAKRWLFHRRVAQRKVGRMRMSHVVRRGRLLADALKLAYWLQQHRLIRKLTLEDALGVCWGLRCGKCQ